MANQEAVPYLPQADSFDVKAALNNIKSSVLGHLWVVVFIFLATVTTVLTYIVIWPPTFQANVVIAAENENDLTRNAFYQQWNIFRREAIGDEAILMTSDPILKRVVYEMDLKYEDVYHPFSSYLIHLWGESWVGSNYRKVKYWFFPKPPLPEGLTEEMIEKFKVLKDFRESVSLQPIGENNVALLLVRGPSPRVSDMANKVIDVYLEERRNRYVEEARLASESLQVETDKAYSRLAKVEAELLEFYAQNSLYLTFEKDRLEMSQWLTLQSDVRDLQAYESQLLDHIETLSKQLAEEGQLIQPGQVFQNDLLDLRTTLTQLQINYRLAKQKFQTGSPEILDFEQQISTLQDILREKGAQLEGQESKTLNESYETLRSRIGVLKADLAGTRASMNSKLEAVERLKPIMEELPMKMQKTHQLQREQLVLESQYKGLNDKLVQAQISMTTALSAPSAIRIVDRATPPDKKSWPNTKLMLLVAGIFGIVVGVISALGLDVVFVRVNRYRFINTDGGNQIFAVLASDEDFIDQVYQISSR